jgi:large subunit ribosomal protein L13
MMIVNADGAILGRISSKIAKELLKGQVVTVVNAEKVVVTGNSDAIMERFKEKRARGDRIHGPFYPRYPDRILRRTIRGMLPYKKDKGEKAFKKLKIFMGNPQNLTGEKMGKTSDDLTCKFMTLSQISKKIGAKID